MIRRMKNRHLVVVLDDQSEIDMRPPTVEEWAKIVEFYELADLAVTIAATQIDPTYAKGPTVEEAAAAVVNRASWGKPDALAPYSLALAETINLLSRTHFDAGHLPMWSTQNTFGVLLGHWRQVQITVEGEPAMTPPPVPAQPWADNETDPDAPPVVDIEALAAVEPDSPAEAPVVGGLAAGRPTAAAV